ncbi:DUF1269 domain-containing protein [Streptomyces sp. NPDC005786]|uniref:DUF1269 domain-containing protein n=1 Tax=Streptomyces sp. NPDC005786 TaxID=3154891 RepID=UPI0033C934DA
MSTLTVWKFQPAEGAEDGELLMPLLGAAIGAAAGALGGKPADVGIDDDLFAEVKEKVAPGTSALYLLTMNEVPDRIGEALPGGGAELLHGNLDTRSEERLRDVFGEDAA